jgi:molybdenum transport protein
MYIADRTIDDWIKEDVPYLDLTTQLLGIGERRGRLAFYTREETTVCGTEEVLRIFAKLGMDPGSWVPSGTVLPPGSLIVEGKGSAEALHLAWKISVNVLEYASGIAGRTRALYDAARSVYPGMEIVATRKMFPGTKELAVKAVVAGGGLPHRLGLSETILVFDHHRSFMVGSVAERIAEIKKRACEKKVIVESTTIDDADGIQFDKVEPAVLGGFIKRLRSAAPHMIVLAAGGINASNVAAYAAAGPDAVATSAMYFGKPADIRATMEAAER